MSIDGATALVTRPELFDGMHPLLEQARNLAQSLERTLHLADAPALVPADTEEIDARSLQEITGARKSIEVVATVSLATAGFAEQVARGLCRARLRGVRVTVLLGPHDLTHPRSTQSLRQLHAAGVNVRIAMYAPSLMLLVVDRRVAVVRPVESGESGLVVNGTPLVPALANLALAYWARSTRPYGRQSETELVKLTAHERHQLMGLLVSGVKDEAAARDLGVSLRTYRRYVRQLMDALGARSRFEAGFLAAERGWYATALRSRDHGQ